MVKKSWRIIPRPLMESLLNNHTQHHRVPQPLILHGPRGVGKTTLILERTVFLVIGMKDPTSLVMLISLNRSKIITLNTIPFPWYSWSICDPPPLSELTKQLEQCLESMVWKGIKLGSITSQQVFSTLKKWHGLNGALHRVLENNTTSKNALSSKASGSVLWSRAIFSISSRYNVKEIDSIMGMKENEKSLSVDEASYIREAVIALKLAKEVIDVQHGWRSKAIAHLNQTGGFSRSLAHSCTDWPYLLLELLSQAAETDHFQPKLVINNIEVLRNAVLTIESSVNASMYHDSLIWRIIALGANERCIPVILVTSDSYYSYRAFLDFGFIDIFISRETFGWTPQEAKMHMVADYFSNSEWSLISEVLGPNPRHLFELYALKQSNYYYKIINDKTNTFEDIVDAYLGYLQITVVNPAMDRALKIIQKFAADAQSGRIPKDKLRFGAAWRHPPRSANPVQTLDWAKLQLLDFVQCLVNTEFGINYLADCSLEILDDPAAAAMVEVGLIYAQRDPSFMRPISRGIQRCLVRWFVQEQIQMNLQKSLQYRWHRFFRGRYYRHLMLQVGYK